MDNLSIKDSVLLMNISLYVATVFIFLLFSVFVLYFIWKLDRRLTRHFLDLRSALENKKNAGGK